MLYILGFYGFIGYEYGMDVVMHGGMWVGLLVSIIGYYIVVLYVDGVGVYLCGSFHEVGLWVEGFGCSFT